MVALFLGARAFAADEPPAHEILVLNSYHPGYTWSDDETAGIQAELKAAGLSHYIEFLDCKNFSDNAHFSAVVEYLRRKYSDRNIGIMLATDNPALEFAIQNRAQLFPDAAIVFCGVNDFGPEMLQGQRRVTGVAEIRDVQGSIELALKLQPEAKRFFVIHDYTVTGLALRRVMRELTPRYADRVAFEYAPEEPLADLLPRLERLEPDQLVLILSYATDRRGTVLDYPDLVTLLAAHCGRPIYAAHESCLGCGIVGGSLSSGTAHGREAARIALRILRGADPDAIPIEQHSHASFMADFVQLTRFGMDPAALPADTLVINRPESFLSKHWRLTVGTLAVIVALTTVTIVLSVNIRMRRHAETTLRDSEERFRLLFQQAPVGYQSLDSEGRLIEVNQVWLDLLGYSREEVIDKDFCDFLTESGGPFFQKQFLQFKESGEIHGVEYQLKRKDGSTLRAFVEGRIGKTSQGGFQQTHCVLYDITERHRAEAALREAEQRYALALQASNEGLFDYFAAADMLHFSPRWYTMLGYQAYEYPETYETWTRLLHPDDRDSVEREVWNLIETGEPWSYEFRMRRQDGSYAWILGRGQCVERTEDGRPKRIVGTHTDITAGKEAEEALRRSEEQYRTLFETMTQGVVYQDADGHVTSANPAAERILGLTVEQMQGRTSSDPRWNTIHEDGSEFPGETHPAMIALRTGEPVSDVLMGIHNPSRDERVWIMVNAIPQFRSGEISPYQVYATLEDVTERRRTELAVREAEALFRTLFENSISGVALHEIVTDEEGRAVDGLFVAVNPAFERQTGESAASVVGRRITEIIPGATEAGFLERFGEVALTGRPIRFEQYMKQLNRYYDIQAYSPRPRQFAVVFSDITERRRAEEEVAKLAKFPSENPNPVLRIDAGGAVLYANASGAALLKDWTMQAGAPAADYLSERAPALLAAGLVTEEEIEVGDSTFLLTFAPVAESGYVNIYGRDISERRRAEQALRESETRYRSLFENMRNGFAYCRMIHEDDHPVDFEYLAVNDAFETLTGLKNVVGKRVSEVIPGVQNNDPELIERYGRVARTREPETFEFFLSSLKEWFVISAYSPVPDHFVAVFDVVTERKRAEEKLRLTKERLELAQRASGAGMWDWDVTTGRLEWSDELFGLFGLDAKHDEATFDAWRGIIHPDDCQTAEERLKAALDNRTTLMSEYRVLLSDGQIRWIHALGEATYDDSGRPVRMSGLCLDITERKRAEEALRRSEAILNDTGMIARIGGWEHDLETGRGTWTKALHDIIEFEPGPVPGPNEHLDYYPPESRALLAEAYSKAVETGEPFDIEVQCSTAKGKSIWARVIGRPEFRDGRCVRMYGTFQDVTDRKRAEDALRESEAFIRTILDNLPIGIAVNSVDPAVKFSYFNDNFRKLYRTTRDALAHPDAFWEAVYQDPDFREEMKQKVLEDCASGDPERLHWDDIPITRQGEETTYICARNTPLPDGKMMVSTVWEVTERKRAEQALVQHSRFLETLIDVIPSAVFWKSPDGLYRGCNETFCQWLGRPREQIVGRTIHDVSNTDAARIHQRYDDELFRNPGKQVYGIQIKPLQGETRDVLFQKATYANPAGEIAGLVGVITDISEIKRAEQALRESEQRYRTLIETAADAIFIADPETNRIIDVNRRAEELLGRRREEIIGTPQLRLHPPEETEKANQAFADALENQGCFISDLHVLHADGRRIPVEINSGGVVKAGDRKLHLGIFRDVSERKNLERQLRESQKMEAVGQLAGGVAHDFNNILTIILGNVELTLDAIGQGASADNPLLLALREINHGAQRAATLTRQLLAFSRRQVSQPQVLDLNRTLGEMEKMLRRLISENITLEFIPAPQSSHVNADPGQMEQVVMNLIVNARDAMPDGGKLVLSVDTVVLDDAYVGQQTFAQLGPHAVISVSDTGCGMEPATIEHIFEPFFTTKAVGKGTGLGLSTVYGIVKQAGGHIMVYSEPGRGSTFKVYLPAVLEQEEASRPQQIATEALTGAETILLCEDEETVRRVTEQFLRNAGYTVLSASSGQAALEMVRDHPGRIDMLLTDVVMPGMSGSQLAATLAKDAPNLKMLFISGYAANIIDHHGMLEENVELLEKPFTRRALLQRVRRILDQERNQP